MKRYINSKTIPLLVLLSSFVASILHIWGRGIGPDENNLYQSNLVGWILLWLLTAATAAAVVFAVRGLKNPGSYQDNYPKSLLAGLCSVPAAVIMLFSGLQQFTTSAEAVVANNLMRNLTGILGLVAGVCLLVVSVYRIIDKKPHFLLNGAVCVYLAVRLFYSCVQWSNQPQVGIVILPFLASVALMLSTYQRVCFDVALAKRPVSALWGLMSVFLCIVAIFSFDQPLFYGLCALWKLTDLCSMRPLRSKPQVEEPQAEEFREEQ